MGSDLPRLGVMLFTYDRFETARRTLEALTVLLRYEGSIHLHIADDGSLTPPDYPRALIAGLPPFYDSVSSTVRDRVGYGGSYNAATQAVHPDCEVLLPLEDDWELTREFDATPLVRTLMEDDRIDCIRLGYLGQTKVLYGYVIDTVSSGKMLLFDEDSPERHVFAGHPRLETREFERRVGPWPEGIQAGQTEFEVSGRHESRQGVAWPLDLGLYASQRHDSLFRHIGEDGKGEIDPTA